MFNYRDGALVAVLFLTLNFSCYGEMGAANANQGIFAQLKGIIGSMMAESGDSAENEVVLIPSFIIDKDKANEGLLRVSQEEPCGMTGGKKMKVIVTKGTERYSYELGRQADVFIPLQMGNGAYSVKIVEKITGKDYRCLRQDEVFCAIDDPTAVFLHPSQMVNWHADMEAMQQARSMTVSSSSDEEAFAVIYDFIVKNFSYDWDKLNNLPGTYRTDLDEVFHQRKGICYDYASLLAGMMRSVGIPCRLHMGESDLSDGYHAWNEVYLDGEWQVVDATVDAQAARDNQGYCTFKEPTYYHAVRTY